MFGNRTRVSPALARCFSRLRYPALALVVSLGSHFRVRLPNLFLTFVSRIQNSKCICHSVVYFIALDLIQNASGEAPYGILTNVSDIVTQIHLNIWMGEFQKVSEIKYLVKTTNHAFPHFAHSP
jgi:hypothetical protein